MFVQNVMIEYVFAFSLCSNLQQPQKYVGNIYDRCIEIRLRDCKKLTKVCGRTEAIRNTNKLNNQTVNCQGVNSARVSHKPERRHRELPFTHRDHGLTVVPFIKSSLFCVRCSSPSQTQTTGDLKVRPLTPFSCNVPVYLLVLTDVSITVYTI